MSNHQEPIIAFTRLQRSFHNHLLHFMVFFIITGLPLLSTSFSFLGSLFALPYDFIGSVYTDLSTSGLTDNERLAAGLQVARIIHRLTALLFLIMAIPFVVVQLAHIRNWAIWPEDSWALLLFLTVSKACGSIMFLSGTPGSVSSTSARSFLPGP